MSDVIRSLIVKVGANTADFSGKMKNISKDLAKTGKNITNVGKNLTYGVTMPILAAGAGAFKLASDFEESLNKVDVAFGNNAKEVLDWSKTTLKQYGMAQGSALDMAALFGDMATGMGINTDEAANMSTQLVALAGDLSSFKNIGIDQAENALKGIFTGEGESLKSLGIIMTQTNLDAFALANGFGKVTKDMTEAEKINLRLAFVMDRTKNAQGDFARTGGGAANQMRIFTESLKELATSFGQILLPMITPIIKKINDAIQKFGALDEKTKKMIVTFALVAGAVGPVLLGVGGLITKLSGAFGAISKFSKAMKGGSTIIKALGVMMGPSGLVILGLAAFAAAAVLIWKNWDKITAAVKKAIDKVKAFFGIKDKGSGEPVDPSGFSKGYGKYTQYAKGTNYVPNDGLAYLHKGEAVVPAKYNNQSGTTTINHTGTIRVEGVNSKGELMGVVELLGKQISQDNRRLPNRASVIPI